MFSSVQNLSATFLIATSLVSASSLAMAAPVTNGGAIRNATPSTVETVRWWGWGAPAAAFVAGGRIGGGAAARPLLPRRRPLRGISGVFQRRRRRRWLLCSTVQVL